MTRLSRFLRRFRRSERGSATIEFAIMTPVMLGLCMSTVELGMLLTRQVMLDRGVDMAVREVRVGALDPVTQETLRTAICANAIVIPDCINVLKLEMRQVNPRAWAPLPAGADCINRNDPAIPVRAFFVGGRNELMILRACAIFEPIMPTTGLGAAIPQTTRGHYALTSTTSYVVEPN